MAEKAITGGKFVRGVVYIPGFKVGSVYHPGFKAGQNHYAKGGNQTKKGTK